MRRRWSQEEFARTISGSHARVSSQTPTGRRDEPPPGNAGNANTLRVGRKVERLEGLPLLKWQLECAGAPAPLTELRFHDTRQWRADLAWLSHLLIVEYEGGVHTGGRHTRGQGFEDDVDKYNAAVLAGWRVLRATYRTVESGQALNETLQALGIPS